MPSSVSRASISSAFLLVIAIGGILFTRPDDVTFHLTGESSATRLRYRRIPGVSRPASFPSEPRSVRDRTLRRRAEAPPSSDEHRAAGRYCGACGWPRACQVQDPSPQRPNALDPRSVHGPERFGSLGRLENLGANHKRTFLRTL